jgi:predicted RNA-binding protein
MNRKNWRLIYRADMSKLHELLDTVEEKIKTEHKKLYEHLEENDFSVGAAFSPLFITLYIY